MPSAVGEASSLLNSWPLLAVALLIAVSTLFYGSLSGGTKNIWILPDELTYGLLARSFAATGHFAIRGVSTLAFPIGYPALIWPAFAGRGPVAAYEAAKWLNALLMSLAAVPTLLIARRLVSAPLAVLAAALTLLIPSMAYTGVLMSENGFFPVFMLVMLAFVRALERPTAGRQLVALVAIVPAVAVRSEGLVLFPALLAAIVLVALGEARGRDAGGYCRAVLRELDRFRATWIALPAGLAAIIAGEGATGRAPTALLGRYADAVGTYPVLRTLRWAVYEVVDLEFYVVVLPLIPACIAAFELLRRRDSARPRRAVAAVAVTTFVLYVLTAATTSQAAGGVGADNYLPLPPELHDRYCFFVTPLVIVLFLYWLRHRTEYSTRALLLLLAGACALPLVLPYASVHGNAEFDALALLPWSNSLVAGRNVHYAMAVTALVLSALLLSRRGSIVMAQVLVVALGLSLMGLLAAAEIRANSLKPTSSRFDDRSWVDEAVPAGANVAVVWRAEADWSRATLVHREQALWRAEFLNSSVDRFFYLGTPMNYGLPETRATLVRGRLAAPSDTRPYRYVLTAGSVPLDGRVIARDAAAGLVLYRLDE